MAVKSLTIAGIQMLVTGDILQNEKRILAAVKRAAEDKARFLLTPEGSLSGYRAEFNGARVASALARVTRAARKAGVGLALGTCFKEKNGKKECCYNQVRVYAPEGDLLGVHNKILRTTNLDFPGTGEMADYVEGTLRAFDWKGVRFGVLICNDMWASPHVTTLPNPHLAWQLKKMGAQFILHAVNSGLDQRMRPYHESTVEIRARSLKLPIVEVNAAKPDGKAVNARSGLVLPDGTRPEIVPDTGEHYFVCRIPLASLQ
jgi:predicted amidohydrolase